MVLSSKLSQREKEKPLSHPWRAMVFLKDLDIFYDCVDPDALSSFACSASSFYFAESIGNWCSVCVLQLLRSSAFLKVMCNDDVYKPWCPWCMLLSRVEPFLPATQQIVFCLQQYIYMFHELANLDLSMISTQTDGPHIFHDCIEYFDSAAGLTKFNVANLNTKQ